MTTASFWESAWAIVERLEAGPLGTDDASLVAELAGDLNLQTYAFMVREFDDPAWLLPFRQDGLFDVPPPVELVDGGMRARGWPALIYLRAVAGSEPAVSAEILEGVISENWWVVSDALSVAAELPAEVAKRPILSLLREWERSAIQWTEPETLIKSLRAIADTETGEGALTEALSRILGRFTDDRSNRYDLSELLPKISAELGEAVVTPLADAVEGVLLLRLAKGDWRAWAYGLDDLRVDADSLELLVHEWLTSVAIEAKASSGFAPLRRCVRLLRTDAALVRQMGLRALSVSLSTEPAEPRALQVLQRLTNRDDLTVNYEELPELLRLFAAHLSLLEPEQQASLIQRIADQAVSPERMDRIFARDWLGALRSHLGARERQLLADLKPDLGPPRDSFARPRAEAVWVGPRSSLTLEELQAMPVSDLLGYVRHVPIRSDEHWPYDGANPEGFARLLQPLVRNRFEDLCEHLAELARAAESSVVLFYLCWGVRDAFGEETARTPERLSMLQEFISAATEWAQDPAAPDSAADDHGYSVARAVADLLESLGDWLTYVPDEVALLQALEWLLTSDDPPTSEPDGTGMDPPSRAINSVRGEAVLAALRMLSAYWDDNGRANTDLKRGIEGLLDANVRVEASPAVLSSYARYLAAIVTHWPSFFEEHQRELLPMDPESIDRWGAVLGTYVTFYGPHRSTASTLRPHFELAVRRLSNFGESYIGKHVERLLMHLVALALPGGVDSDSWLGLLHNALDKAEPEATARAIHDLAFAVEHDRIEIPREWTLSFVARRARSLTARRSTSRGAHASNPDESSALVGLVFANGVRPSDCIGHIRHLVELGARLGFDDTVEYLTNHDPDSSHSGAVILQLSAAQRAAEGYMRHLDDAKRLIRNYAAEHVDVAWKTVEALGADGLFAFEDVARELFDQRAAAAG